MKYKFKEIDNGQICEGPVVVVILNGVADITTPEQEALAQKHGGKLVKEAAPKPEVEPGVEPEIEPETKPEFEPWFQPEIKPEAESEPEIEPEETPEKRRTNKW